MTEAASLDESLTASYDIDLAVELAKQEEEEESASRFVVDDESKAEWALLKMRQAMRKVRNAVELANAERARIDRWEEEQTNVLRRQAAFFESLLIEYHHNELNEDPARKTIKLPAGVLKSRKPPAHIEVDADEFIPWAKDRELPGLLRVKVEPDKAALKKLLVPDAPEGKAVDAETGEIIPGVVIERGDIRFTVEVTP